MGFIIEEEMLDALYFHFLGPGHVLAFFAQKPQGPVGGCRKMSNFARLMGKSE